MSHPRLHVPHIRPAEVPTLVVALVVAAVVETGLRLTTLPRLARALGTPLAVDGRLAYGEREHSVGLPEWAVSDMNTARRVLRRWPFADTCLRQALVCGWLLRRLEPRLQLGVARIDGEVRAHAWLVVNGAVVDPRHAVSAYQPLATLRAGGAR
ncbi:MAG TPA: lasso peptide biosynthesis B2 protein [Nocardioides sp.]|nr:lasso peptide biosynthesis B2 protein [Nocardioides sp.]